MIARIKDGRFAAKWEEVQENGSAELEQGYKRMREDPMMVEERAL